MLADGTVDAATKGGACSRPLASPAVTGTIAASGAGTTGTGSALALAALSVALLAVLHLLAPHIRRLPLVPEYATASFAGGIAVSYVFLHLLPELSNGNRELREVLGEEGAPSPLLGLEVFLIALVGFAVFYGLERLAERSRDAEGTPERTTTGDRGPGAPRSRAASPQVFRVHLASFMVYNAIIAYTLPLTYRTSVAFAVLFTVAMALHFVLTDRGLEEHYGSLFDRRRPRVLLAAALVLGWLLAALFAPTGSLVVTLLTAFLAGSILLNVFKEEIPSTRRSHYGWFIVGLVSYALLLGLVTALGETASSPEAEHEASAAVEPTA